MTKQAKTHCEKYNTTLCHTYYEPYNNAWCYHFGYDFPFARSFDVRL